MGCVQYNTDENEDDSSPRFTTLATRQDDHEHSVFPKLLNIRLQNLHLHARPNECEYDRAFPRVYVTKKIYYLSFKMCRMDDGTYTEQSVDPLLIRFTSTRHSPEQ